MSKYGKSNRQRAVRQNAILSASESVWMRPNGEAHEDTFDIHFSESLRLVNRTMRLVSNGMLVEFAISLIAVSHGENFELYSIDSCHDKSVHLHKNGHESEIKIILKITSDRDLDVGFKLAHEMIIDFATKRGVTN